MKHWFVLLIWIGTLAAVFLFVGRGWWLPSNGAGDSAESDHQFLIIITVLGAVFAIAQISTGYLVQRFRTASRETQAGASQSSYGLEIAWTVATAVIFFMLAMMGQYVWMRLSSQKAATSTVQVSRVIQRQQAD